MYQPETENQYALMHQIHKKPNDLNVSIYNRKPNVLNVSNIKNKKGVKSL